MKRKALIFIEDGSYSYDSRVTREATALVEAGWDVTIISPKYSADPFYRRISDRLRAYYYPKPTTESLVGQAIEHSISLVLGTLLTFWVFCRHGFSILHACNPVDILWIIALPYKLLGRRFIFDHHDLCPELLLSRGSDGKGLVYRILLSLEAASFRVADVVIATNESYREVAITRGRKHPGRVFVVRNGPDVQRFHPVPPRRDPRFEGKTVIGYIGNMNLQDGVEHLIEAARAIVFERRRSDVAFVLVGGGSQQQKLADRVREMGLGQHVVLTGRIPEEEVLGTLCACEVCVQPDPLNPLNDKSTMNKAMEYMALRKAVVAFDLKETRVSCGEAALYASAGSVTDLADKIVELVDKPQLRAELGQRGYDRVRQVLAWNHSVPHLLEAYESALEVERKLAFGSAWRQWIARGLAWLRAVPHGPVGSRSGGSGACTASAKLSSTPAVECFPGQFVSPPDGSVACNGHVTMTVILPPNTVDISRNLAATYRAAAQLQGTANLRMLIAGDEEALLSSRDTEPQLDLRHVEFRSAAASDRFSSFLAEGDIHVIFQGRERESLAIPQSISDALATGRPSVFIGPADCEAAVILQDSRSGLVVAPGDMEGLEEGIRTLICSPALRQDMGRNAMDYYEYYLHDDAGLSRMEEILRRLCWGNEAGREGYSDTVGERCAGESRLQAGNHTLSHS